MRTSNSRFAFPFHLQNGVDAMIINIVLLILTAVIAGLVPTLLFFATAADKRVLVIGGLATAASYLPVALGLPILLGIRTNGLALYPLWAILLAFPIGLVWKLVQGAAPPPPTEEERIAEIQAKARAKARALREKRDRS